MTMLSIGVLAMNRAMQEALETRAMARDYTEARFLIEQVMSELEMQPLLMEGASKAGAFGKDHPRFSYAWTVSRYDFPEPVLPPDVQQFLAGPVGLPEPYLGKIQVTVNWTRRDRTYSRRVETLIPPEKLVVLEPEGAAPDNPQR
jgi:hypothetical protein